MTDQTLDPEDAKIVTLARGARLRGYAPHTGRLEGAAVRDTDGRTYAAATVENADPALTLSALRIAVATAASSGARRFEAVALVTETGTPLDPVDATALKEFGDGTAVITADAAGTVTGRTTAGAS